MHPHFSARCASGSTHVSLSRLRDPDRVLRTYIYRRYAPCNTPGSANPRPVVPAYQLAYVPVESVTYAAHIQQIGSSSQRNTYAPPSQEIRKTFEFLFSFGCGTENKPLNEKVYYTVSPSDPTIYQFIPFSSLMF
jgi:hypothetical protein